MVTRGGMTCRERHAGWAIEGRDVQALHVKSNHCQYVGQYQDAAGDRECKDASDELY